MQRFSDSILSNSSSGVLPLAYASVTVYLAGTTTTATIYSDNGITVKVNPFKSSVLGVVEFYGADGRYDLYVSHPDYAPVWVRDVLLNDTVSDGTFTTDSTTVTFSGDGEQTSPLIAAVRVSGASDNVLTIGSGGLYVPASASGLPEAPDDGSTYGRGSNAWQGLAEVATSGDYDDLSNKPAIPTIPGVATPSADGLMSSGDKTKLNGIAAGAQVNTVTSVAGRTGTVTLTKADVGLGSVDNTADSAKPVSTAQATAIGLKADKTLDLVAGNGLTGGGTLAANRSFVLGTPSTLTGATTNAVTATSHTHAVTVTQTDVGLSNVNNTSDAAKPVSTAQAAALGLKVDKEAGKGLSTEDYTSAEKTKLAGIATGATANTGTVTSVQASVPTGLSVSGGPVTGAGTLAITYTTGYSLPTTAKQTQWDTAFGWGNHATAGYALASSLATVATSGSYADLTNKPTIPSAQVNANWTAVSGIAQILNKPTLGTLAAKNQVAVSDISASGTPGDTTYLRGDGTWGTPEGGGGGGGIPEAPIDGEAYGRKDSAWAVMSSVATSGAYDDLIGKPTIPVIPGVATTTANGLMSSGDKVKLNGIATGATANTGTVTSVQAAVPTGLSVSGGPVTGAGTLTFSYTAGYAIPTTAKQGQWDTAYSWGNHATAGYALASSLAAVATSGSYNDLANKPTIPAAQVNSDWNASSGLAQILNKPTIPTPTPYPGAGIAISTGTAWGASKNNPAGDLVGTTESQTITNKTLGANTKESVTTGSTITINDAAASFQQLTLTANSTASISLSVGVSRTIWVNPGTHTISWPVNTVLVGDIANLPASKWSCITLTGMPNNTAGIAALVGSQS